MTGSAQVRTSPRTAERPMAFSGDEFVHGAYTAWGAFVLAGTLVGLILSIPSAWSLGLSAVVMGGIGVAVFLPLVLGFVSMFFFLPGLLLARLLGLLLQRVRAPIIHLAAFTTFGCLLGVVALYVLWPRSAPVEVLAIAIVALSGLACAFGWWRAYRRAQSADRPVAAGTGGSA